MIIALLLLIFLAILWPGAFRVMFWIIFAGALITLIGH